MKKISINDINFDLDYEGYYWYSNQSKPELVQHQKISKDIFTELPFIVEGNFFAKNEELSISIKFIDGKYYIYQADLSGLQDAETTRNEFIAHDLEGIDKIKMVQVWEESPEDPLLENMKTLKPAWQAFVGFVKK